MKLAHGHHCGVQGIHLATDDSLQSADNLSTNLEGINAQMGHATVSTLTSDRQIKAIHSGHKGSRFDADFPFINCRPKMTSKCIIDFW